MKIMSLKETAAYLRVHPMTLYRLAKQGKIHCFKVGGQWRFTKESIEKEALRSADACV